MPNNFELTPQVFDKIEADYQKALRERRRIIIQQSTEEKMSQREIAKYWDLDPARVHRIIKSKERKG